MQKKDKRKQILLAVEKIVRNRRFHEITIDEIAQEAGVGKGTVYRYFEDKEDIFFQLATSGFEELCDMLEKVSRGECGFEERLVKMCSMIDDFFETRSTLFRIMHEQEGQARRFGKEFHETMKARTEKLDCLVASALEKGVAEGRINRSVDTGIKAKMLLGLMGGCAFGFRNNPDDKPSIKEIVEQFLYGVPGAS